MFHPNTCWTKVAPATKLTDILVNTYPNMEMVAKKIWIRLPPKRRFMYSGIVYTPEAMYTGRKIQPKIQEEFYWRIDTLQFALWMFFCFKKSGFRVKLKRHRWLLLSNYEFDSLWCYNDEISKFLGYILQDFPIFNFLMACLQLKV